MVRNERTAFAFRVLQGSTGSHAKTTVLSCWTLLLRDHLNELRSMLTFDICQVERQKGCQQKQAN